MTSNRRIQSADGRDLWERYFPGVQPNTDLKNQLRSAMEAEQIHSYRFTREGLFLQRPWVEGNTLLEAFQDFSSEQAPAMAHSLFKAVHTQLHKLHSAGRFHGHITPFNCISHKGLSLVDAELNGATISTGSTDPSRTVWDWAARRPESVSRIDWDRAHAVWMCRCLGEASPVTAPSDPARQRILCAHWAIELLDLEPEGSAWIPIIQAYSAAAGTVAGALGLSPPSPSPPRLTTPAPTPTKPQPPPEFTAPSIPRPPASSPQPRPTRSRIQPLVWTGLAGLSLYCLATYDTSSDRPSPPPPPNTQEPPPPDPIDYVALAMDDLHRERTVKAVHRDESLRASAVSNGKAATEQDGSPEAWGVYALARVWDLGFYKESKPTIAKITSGLSDPVWNEINQLTETAARKGTPMGHLARAQFLAQTCKILFRYRNQYSPGHCGGATEQFSLASIGLGSDSPGWLRVEQVWTQLDFLNQLGWLLWNSDQPLDILDPAGPRRFSASGLDAIGDLSMAAADHWSQALGVCNSGSWETAINDSPINNREIVDNCIRVYGWMGFDMEQRGEKIIKDSAHVQNYAQWGRWLRAYDARLARSTGKPDDRSPDYWVSWRSVHTIVTSAHPECASVQVAWKNVGDRYRVTSPAANLPEPDFNTFQADPHHVLHRCYVASLMLLGCEAEARRHVTQLDFAVQVYKAEYADPMFFLGDDPVLYVSIEQWISEYRTLLASGTEAACYLDARR